MGLDTFNNWSMIVSWIVGLGGLFVAFLTALWANKNKIEPYKKEMYDRQIEATAECLDALVKLQYEIETTYIQLNRPLHLDKDETDIFKQRVNSRYRDLKRLLLKWSVILPENVYTPFVHYLTTIEYTTGHRILIDGWAGATYYQLSPWRNCASNYLMIIEEVRLFLGADKLKKELSKTFKEKNKLDISNELNPLAYLLSDDYRPFDRYEDGFQFTSELGEKFGFKEDNEE